MEQQTIKKIRKSLFNFRQFKIQSIFQLSQNFDKAMTTLMSNDHVKSIKNLLTNMSLLIGHTGKICSTSVFLSIYPIYFFPKDIFCNSHTLGVLELNLIQKSKQLISLIENEINLENDVVNKKDMTKDITKDIINFILKVDDFSKLFIQWKKKDVLMEIEIYKKLYFKYFMEIEYYDDNKSQEQDQKQDRNRYLDVLEKTHETIEDYLVYLCNHENKEQKSIDEIINLEKIQKILKVNAVSHLVKKYLENKYWSEFSSGFLRPNWKENKLVCSQFLQLIKNVLSSFRKIHKIKQMEQEFRKIKNTLDPEYLEIQIKQGLFSIHTLESLCKSILVNVKLIDSRAFDQLNDELMCRLFIKQNNVENKQSNKKKEVLVILKFVVKRLNWLVEITKIINN